MITITCNDSLYTYDAYHIAKAFYPDEEVAQTVLPDQKAAIVICLEQDGGKNEQEFSFSKTEKEQEMERSYRKHEMIRQVYLWFSACSGRSLPWGSLTGVRPTKMLMEKLEEGVPEEEILSWIQKEHFVTEEKAALGLDIAKRERGLLSHLDYENGYSLYVGVPFCPTICSYCSFSSYPLAKWKEQTDRYVDALCRELSFLAEASRKKHLNTIYMGGGTPTTLEALQLDRLLSHMEQQFSYEHLKELTVEAGRPDSITREKLQVLRDHGIDRISINPQTMNQKTLDLVGRGHTVQQVLEVYELARSLGFDNINMDLIAGLPGEDLKDMEHTLSEIMRLQPDSLTVHALAVKRASKLRQEQREEQFSISESGKRLSDMIEMAADCAGEIGLLPYYLYRQKNMAGNFENVGYAKVDKAGIYNILIMEEKQSILAAGAGASTKIVLPHEIELPGSKSGKKTKLVRIENVKNVEEYMDRIPEMIERKGEWLWH